MGLSSPQLLPRKGRNSWEDWVVDRSSLDPNQTTPPLTIPESILHDRIWYLKACQWLGACAWCRGLCIYYWWPVLRIESYIRAHKSHICKEDWVVNVEKGEWSTSIHIDSRTSAVMVRRDPVQNLLRQCWSDGCLETFLIKQVQEDWMPTDHKA